MAGNASFLWVLPTVKSDWKNLEDFPSFGTAPPIGLGESQPTMSSGIHKPLKSMAAIDYPFVERCFDGKLQGWKWSTSPLSKFKVNRLCCQIMMWQLYYLSAKFRFARRNQLKLSPVQCIVMFCVANLKFIQLACYLWIFYTWDTENHNKTHTLPVQHLQHRFHTDVSGWSLGWWTLWCRVATSNTRATWRALGCLAQEMTRDIFGMEAFATEPGRVCCKFWGEIIL